MKYRNTYEFKLLKNETVEFVSNNALLKYKEKNKKNSIILTSKRMVLLSEPMDQESFRFGKIINYPIKKEILFETELNAIEYIELNDLYDKYVLKNGDYFYINDPTIRKSELLSKYKLSCISPIALDISNLLEITKGENLENMAIVSI